MTTHFGKKHNGKSVEKTTFGRLYCALSIIFISFLRYYRDIKTACAGIISTVGQKHPLI